MQQQNNADDDELPGLAPIPVQDELMQKSKDAEFCRMLNNLTQELLDIPGGQLCSLCTTSNGRECVWNNVAIDMILAGEMAIEMYDVINNTSDIVARHSAAQYACYQKFIFTASSWTPGQSPCLC